MSSSITVKLVSEHPEDLLGLPAKSPLLSWIVDGAEAGQAQINAELQASASADFSLVLAQTSIDGTASQFIAGPGGSLKSRETFKPSRVGAHGLTA